jgi:hypothetical protein
VPTQKITKSTFYVDVFSEIFLPMKKMGKGQDLGKQDSGRLDKEGKIWFILKV